MHPALDQICRLSYGSSSIGDSAPVCNPLATPLSSMNASGVHLRTVNSTTAIGSKVRVAFGN
jgi:hypothetical protein